MNILADSAIEHIISNDYEANFPYTAMMRDTSRLPYPPVRITNFSQEFNNIPLNPIHIFESNNSSLNILAMI